ncbi:hypothetical protein D0Z00_001674 [Geotrichum galactomycetum]|uniref:Uncharacterized protein n=1 Tax=Geotrichum galactomycetum TaxID=27317 RepID=A0ACB6V6D2_9ASCO|nr:hypothetical protein D0Z00_001674 [Geotrichum candidum]
MFRPALPPRICGGSSSKHRICRRNNSFFALSNKWLNLYRQQQAQQQDPAPASSRIPVSTLDYYADPARRAQTVAPGNLDRALFKSLLLAPPSLTAASNESTISNTGNDAAPSVGDLLEFWDPQTQSVALGIIVEIDLKHEVLQAWTLDGTRVRVKPDQITLHLSRIVAPALLMGNSEHSPATIKTHTLALLRLIAGTGYELMRGKLADALLAVHSQTPATTPQPVARIAARALAIARVRNWTTSPLTQVAALLGTHIWLANNPIYYWNFSNASGNGHGRAVSVNGRSKTYWVPYESTLAEESQYIVAELDTQDVVAFGEYLHARRTASQLHPVDADDEEYFESLVAFLKRYIVYPHDQYSNLVATILSHANPSAPEIKADPEHVHKLLIECGLTNTENPLLDSGLVFSYDQETGKVIDKFRASEGSVVNLDLVPYSATDTTHEEFDKKNLTTYVLTSSSSRLPCIGLSLDKSNMKLWELHIHVPNASAIYEPNSRLLKLALRRLRTAHMPEGDRTLFRQPETLHRVARFFGADEIENKKRGTKCVTFSVKFNPWKLAGWGVRDVNVSLNIVRQVTILPVEELEPHLGWSRYNGSLAWQDEDNHNTILQKYLEPVNSIELGGDLTSEHTDSPHNLENYYDFSSQETAMGIPNDHSFSAANPDEVLNHQRALKRRLSIFSDGMTRKDRNNMAAIQEILLNNFWKRLDAGALYVEDTERDYRLPVDVKASPDTGRVELGHRVPIVTRLVTEAEIMAGEIGALFGAKHNLPLFYSKQVLTPTGGISNEALESIGDNRSLDGTLNGVGAYMADRALMDHSETVTEPRHPHFGLGVGAGYVGVARPLDDVRQLISQYQLTAYLAATKPPTHPLSPAKKWPLLNSEQLQAFYTQNRVDERQELLEYFEKSSARYWTLRWLESELERSSGYFVFKCVVLTPAAQYPDLAKGYCLELNMEVDIMLTRRTPTVNMGDRLMCTGILRLVPTTGELVLGN